MPGYVHAQRAPARQKSADGGAAEHRSGMQVTVRDGATASHGVMANALKQSPQAQSLLQMRQAFDEGPRVQSQLALKRALSRRTGPAQAEVAEASPQPASAPPQCKANAIGLPDRLKAGVENPSGFSMDDVRVRYNSNPAAVQVHAYAQGTAPRSAAPVQRAVVIQRWTEGYGGKLSEGNNLLLRGEQDLYASGEKIEEANAIGGQVEFGRGEQINEPKPLTKVVPTVKEGSELAKETQGLDAGKQEKVIRDNIRQRIAMAKFEKEIMDARIEAERKVKGDDFSEEEFRDEIELDVDEEARKKVEDLGDNLPAYEDEPAIRNLNGYLAKQKDAGKPLIPTDCARAVGRIAGFRPTEGVEIQHAVASAVHSYTEKTLDEAEWPYHVATIIMTDGADHVTMENAGARKSEGFDKLEFDRTWYFAMYGTQQGQTFGDIYKKDFRDEGRLHLLGPKK